MVNSLEHFWFLLLSCSWIMTRSYQSFLGSVLIVNFNIDYPPTSRLPAGYGGSYLYHQLQCRHWYFCWGNCFRDLNYLSHMACDWLRWNSNYVWPPLQSALFPSYWSSSCLSFLPLLTSVSWNLSFLFWHPVASLPLVPPSSLSSHLSPTDFPVSFLGDI